MATFLDALADLVVDPVARLGYRHDPAAWLSTHDAGELCAEDVDQAEPTLRRWFDDDRFPAAGPDSESRPPEDGLAGAVRRVDRLLGPLFERDDAAPAPSGDGDGDGVVDGDHHDGAGPTGDA